MQGAIYEAVYNVSGSKTFELPNIPKKGELTSVTSFISTENPSVTYKNPLGSRVTLNICISKNGEYADLAPYRTIS
ncbi:MAG: hypothetical protein KBS91_03960, partial [Firmicutes bacterium]|nr:hypothetical protein [Candidatus Caballimonas caccae]